MEDQVMTFVMLPKNEWEQFKAEQREIKLIVEKRSQQVGNETQMPMYLSPKEFMAAINIKRTKFDQLVRAGKIKAIKKCHKIYIPATEIARYFSDSSIP